MNRSFSRAAGSVVALLGLVACDFEVTNPGPTADAILDRPEAHAAIANGAARLFADAHNYVAYTSGAVTREIFPAGSTSAFGVSNLQQQGRLEYDDEHILPPWQSAQRARYVAESGFARMEETAPNGTTSYVPAANAALWAGFSNRLLGESFCEAVFDGGSIEPRASFFTKAEQWFTTAISIGTAANQSTLVTAAYGARAAVRMHKGDWAGAVSDAARVPNTFRFLSERDNSEIGQYNRVYWASASTPYRAHTVWNTQWETYFADTKDPRVGWGQSATQKQGDAAVGILGGARATWYYQTKYTTTAAGIALTTGWEMRLIEAEALLRDGNVQGALDKMNQRRTALSLPALTAANATEAWTLLKRERGAELWLEGRRLGDLYRWKAGNTPGELHPREQAGNAASYLSASQSLCYPIPKGERETNPNIPVNP